MKIISKLILWSIKLFLFIGISFMIMMITIHTPCPPNLSNLNNKLIKINSNIYNINDGGCGLMSLYISNYLDTLHIPYTIEYIKRNLNQPIPTHVIIKLKGKNIYVDGTGFYKNIYLSLFGNNIQIGSKQNLKHLIYDNPKGWNPKFNRNDTTIIKKILFHHDY